jgi:hypothetical protein
MLFIVFFRSLSLIRATRIEFCRQTNKPLYLSSIAHASAATGQQHTGPPSDRKRSELVHKEEKSFWRSWFGFDDSNSDSDSDDERKHKKNDSKFNSNRPDGPKLSTRKSSAERQTNFNAPTEEEKREAKLAKVSRSSIREIR